MEESGTVVALEGGTARVRLLRRATCDKCGMCGMGQRPEVVVEVPNTAGAAPGDEVRLRVEDSSLLRAAFVAYLVPLLALIAGFLLVNRLLLAAGVRGRELPAIAGGFLACALSYLYVRSYDRRTGRRFVPIMVEVVSRAGAPPREGC